MVVAVLVRLAEHWLVHLATVVLAVVVVIMEVDHLLVELVFLDKVLLVEAKQVLMILHNPVVAVLVLLVMQATLLAMATVVQVQHPQ